MTPVMLARGKYEILKQLRTFCDFPVHTFSKVILCGNSGAGKSTLAQAIISVFNCNEEVGSLKHRVKNLYKAAGPSKLLTAGIIPYNIQSPLGNMVLYDLAGQPEYYTSHCACIEAISLSSPAIFLSLVDISLDLDGINKQLYYWSAMISSVCSKCPHPSEVIVVGTHADLLDKAGLQSRCNVIGDIAKHIFTSANQHLEGSIGLNATDHFSDSMKALISQLRRSNDIVVQRCPVISIDCHILYAFLQQLAKQVITVTQLQGLLQADETNVLPIETSMMMPLLTALSAKGLILFIPKEHNIDDSWIVLQKDVLLKEVDGVLFAPDHFDEYRSLAANTGLVPIYRLKECFPDLDVYMLVEFLLQLKLCLIVDSAHHIITPAQVQFDSTKEYSLFFPSLIKAGRPVSDNINTKGSFGWLMRTKEKHQFFHNRFLHVLMLTLMNGCSGAEILCNPMLTSLNRQCTVWSTGICWNSKEGVTILVEMAEQYRSLYVAASFPGQQYQELTVLCVIRETFKEICPSFDIQEFVIDPHQVEAMFVGGYVPLSLRRVEISSLRDAILNKQDGIIDVSGNVVKIEEWINAEPRLPKLIGIELNNCEPISVVGPQLKDLMNEIAAVIPAKWRDVGIQLDIHPRVLDGIQSQHCRDPNSLQRCFEQVFIEWSKQASNNPYTWTHIIDILRRPAIGENALAETVNAMFNFARGV